MDVASFADKQCGENVQEWLEDVAFVTGTMCDPNEPQTFQQAWWDPDKNAGKKWCEAIRLVFNKMIKIGVWRKVSKMEGNANKRLVGANGSSRSKGMESTEQDWLPKDLAKYQEKILQKTSHQ